MLLSFELLEGRSLAKQTFHLWIVLARNFLREVSVRKSYLEAFRVDEARANDRDNSPTMGRTALGRNGVDPDRGVENS